MKRAVIPEVLLCSVLLALSAGTEKDCYDRHRKYALSIHKMIVTDDSFDEALIQYQALIHAAETGGDERLQAEYLFRAAIIHYWQTDYPASLAETQKALSIAHRFNDRRMMVAGYDLLAQLHYLFSPEQAEYYYHKSRQHCESADCVELAISSLNRFNLINYDREIALDEFLTMDMSALSPLSRACLGCNMARVMFAEGRIEEASRYLDYTRQYLQQHGETTPLNAIYENRIGQLRLLEGDTKQAWEHVERSLDLVRKNRMLIGLVHNYHLSSQIAQAEKNEMLALKYYVTSVALRDSIYNSSSILHFPDELISTMKDFMADDRARDTRKKHLLTGIWLGLILIAGISLFYYFKSKGYREKSHTALANIRNQEIYKLHSRLKSHLMKILYGYKNGVGFCIKQFYEAKHPDFVGDLTVFENDVKTVDVLIERLLGWVETNLDLTPEKSEFDLTEMVQQLVVFHKIGLAYKEITFQLLVEQEIMAHGDQNMLTIALEHLFYNVTKASSPNAVIRVSLSKADRRYAAVSITNPDHTEPTLEKEIFAQRVAELETIGKAPSTADWDFNIFAEFTVRNRAKIRIDHTPEKETMYHYFIPLHDE